MYKSKLKQHTQIVENQLDEFYSATQWMIQTVYNTHNKLI